MMSCFYLNALVNRTFQTLSVSHSWAHLHRHIGDGVSPCTSLAFRNVDAVVSVGEDGRMCFLNLEQRQPVRVIGEGFIIASSWRHSITHTRSCSR